MALLDKRKDGQKGLCAPSFLYALLVVGILLVLYVKYFSQTVAEPRMLLTAGVPRLDFLFSDQRPVVFPEVKTAYRLRPLRNESFSPDGVINAHRNLRDVVQWNEYPFQEQRVDGISRTVPMKVPDPHLDQYFQEFVEDSIPVSGSGLPGLVKVVQHADALYSISRPPFGPLFGHCWGGSQRNPCPSYRDGVGYKVERVETIHKGVELFLIRQGATTPVFQCSHPCVYNFRAEDRGHWFRLLASREREDGRREMEIRRIYVAFPLACGAGLFTRKALTCNRQPQAGAEVNAALADLWDSPATATPDLPFGFELEGVLRIPYTGKERARRLEAVTAYFAGSRSNETFHEMQSNYENPQYKHNQEAVRSCFNNVTGGRFEHWRWEAEDNMFLPHEVDDPEEMWGVPFEFTPPNPPNLSGVSGLEATLDAVAGLAAAGLGTNPRQGGIHMHLMLRDGPGREWTDHDIARFFVGYVRAQYALDFITLVTTRSGGGGAGLYLWDPKVQYVFRNLHQLVRSSPHDRVSEPKWLCDAIMGKGECDTNSPFWPSKHTPLRHYAINFAKVAGFHSLELRGHGPVNDPERLARWVDLTLRMASSFRQDHDLMTFFNEDADKDLKQLHEAQERRSLAELFDDVGLPNSSRNFYLHQSWAKTGKDGTWGPNCVSDLQGSAQRRKAAQRTGGTDIEEVAVRPGALLERHRRNKNMRGHEAANTLKLHDA